MAQTGQGKQGALVFYVSAHGYGHATRQAALIAELLARRPGLAVHVRTWAPARLFPAGARLAAADVDPGLAQPDALTIDLPESLRRHQDFAARWERRAEEEAAFLRSCGARAVVSDVAPLGVEAAFRARIPSYVVGNFTWDWILEAYVEDDPRWRSVVERFAHAYARADALLRLPLHGEFSGFARVVDCPLLVRRSPLSREEARAAMGLRPDDERPLVLASFGGLGLAAPDLTGGDDLSAFVFAGFGPKPPGLRADWVELSELDARAHLDAMAACDVSLTKPGYGTFSEAIAHRARVLYLPREGFVEIPALVRGLETLGFGRPLGLQAFAGGRWRAPLESLLAAPVSWPRARTDGAAFIADLLLQAL